MRKEEECVCSVRLFRCNIFIGVRIIKEIPGSVASGTPCTFSVFATVKPITYEKSSCNAQQYVT